MLSYFWPSKYPLIDRYKDRLSLFSESELKYLLDLQKAYKSYEAIVHWRFNVLEDKSVFSFFALLGLYIQIVQLADISKQISLAAHDSSIPYPYSYIVQDLEVFKSNIAHLKEYFLDNPIFIDEYFDFSVKSQEAIETLSSLLHGNSIEQRIMGKCFLVGIDNNTLHSFHQEELKDIFGEKYQDLYRIRDRYVKTFIEKYTTFFNQMLPLEHATPSACEHTAVCLYEILDKSLWIAADKLRRQKMISDQFGVKF